MTTTPTPSVHTYEDHLNQLKVTFENRFDKLQHAPPPPLPKIRPAPPLPKIRAAAHRHRYTEAVLMDNVI
jgi:hypothetical protein